MAGFQFLNFSPVYAVMLICKSQVADISPNTLRGKQLKAGGELIIWQGFRPSNDLGVPSRSISQLANLGGGEGGGLMTVQFANR